VVLFVIFLPKEHPDSSVNLDVAEEQILAITSEFLSEQGIQDKGLEVVATFKRRPDLLIGLQNDLGRAESIQFLSSESRNVLSGYFWEVKYNIPIDAKTGSIGNRPDLLFRFELAQNGGIVAFEDRNRALGTAGAAFGNTRFNINRKALSASLKADSIVDSDVRSQLGALPDSIIAQFLHFNLAQTTEDPLTGLLKAPSTRLLVALDSLSLNRLIEYHLKSTPFAGLDLRVDSVRIATNVSPFAARIGLQTKQPIAGQHIVLDLLIPPTGTLSSLDAEFKPVVPPSGDVSKGLTLIGGGLWGLFSRSSFSSA